MIRLNNIKLDELKTNYLYNQIFNNDYGLDNIKRENINLSHYKDDIVYAVLSNQSDIIKILLQLNTDNDYNKWISRLIGIIPEDYILHYIKPLSTDYNTNMLRILEKRNQVVKILEQLNTNKDYLQAIYHTIKTHNIEILKILVPLTNNLNYERVLSLATDYNNNQALEFLTMLNN